MAKRAGTGINVGGSSILVIFVLLCLTTFAALSLVSANADARLTKKTAEAAAAYYEADAKAETVLAGIDALLRQTAREVRGRGRLNESAYFEAYGQALLAYPGYTVVVDQDPTDLRRLSVSYVVPAGERQELRVRLRVQGSGSPAPCRVEQWQVFNTGEWMPDETIDLWTGDAAGAAEGAVGADPWAGIG